MIIVAYGPGYCSAMLTTRMPASGRAASESVVTVISPATGW